MEKDLEYYRNHPIYGVGYDSVVSYLGIIGMKDGVEFSNQDYLDVFIEAEYCVNRVLQSNTPEIELPRVFAYLKNKYQANKTKSEYMTIQHITHYYCIGSIIQMLFVTVTYDRMPIKTERIKNTFIEIRAFIENQDVSYIYKNDAMWKLIAERIPAFNRPRIEDLQVKIGKLNDELEQFRTGNASMEWHKMVLHFTKHFNDIMKPEGFYELPKVEVLTPIGQYMLIVEMISASMPYRVALLHQIEFMRFFSKKEKYAQVCDRLKLIENAFGLTRKNRELSGNFNVLNPKSRELTKKYTAQQHIEEANSFYEQLPKIPN